MKEVYMSLALKEAEKAFLKGEVPIGVVIVKDDKILAKAHNTRRESKNAINHAEIIAIQKACKRLKDWRLENAEIYVTLEPCPMCAGAIANARIKECYFGAFDKSSETDFLKLIFQDKRLNHKVIYRGGIMEEECSKLLTSFFKEKRKTLKNSLHQD